LKAVAKRYTRDHEWIEVDGENGTVGISDYAQQQLGDIVFVELPPVGKTVKQHDQIAVIESVKAASEVYVPVSGTITEVNGALAAEPQLVNQSAEDRGWFFRLRLSQAGELESLMDTAAYAAFVEGTVS
jgi:glycine cleavage system H protein